MIKIKFLDSDNNVMAFCESSDCEQEIRWKVPDGVEYVEISITYQNL